MDSNWTRVEEGLPEETIESYLVYGSPKPGYSLTVMEAVLGTNGKDFYKDGFIVENITHWQPLPLPPIN